MADRGAIERAFQQMLEAVKTSNPQFVFDREGRPGAIAAIRGALPMIARVVSPGLLALVAVSHDVVLPQMIALPQAASLL